MPLSEQELRTLEELEAQLSAEDPKFASAMNGDPVRRRRRQRVTVISSMVLLGFALVVAGVLTKFAWIGLIGALVLAGGAMYALQSPTRSGLRSTDPSTARSGSSAHLHDPFATLQAKGVRPGRVQAGPRAGASPFMHRMEERWERRRRENQGW